MSRRYIIGFIRDGYNWYLTHEKIGDKGIYVCRLGHELATRFDTELDATNALKVYLGDKCSKTACFIHEIKLFRYKVNETSNT